MTVTQGDIAWTILIIGCDDFGLRSFTIESRDYLLRYFKERSGPRCEMVTDYPGRLREDCILFQVMKTETL